MFLQFVPHTSRTPPVLGKLQDVLFLEYVMDFVTCLAYHFMATGIFPAIIVLNMFMQMFEEIGKIMVGWLVGHSGGVPTECSAVCGPIWLKLWWMVG